MERRAGWPKGQTLIPGMPVDVFFNTSERTPIEYLLKPITDFFLEKLPGKLTPSVAWAVRPPVNDSLITQYFICYIS